MNLFANAGFAACICLFFSLHTQQVAFQTKDTHTHTPVGSVLAPPIDNIAVHCTDALSECLDDHLK